MACNDVEECECNLGYYANFEHNDKKYCSRCYQIKTGKLLSNFKSWSNTKNFYNKLKVPIKLVYGEDDWANKANRYSTMNKLNLNTYLTINDCGHFSFLEKPKEVANIILR